jgi:hypothetical protein
MDKTPKTRMKKIVFAALLALIVFGAGAALFLLSGLSNSSKSDLHEQPQPLSEDETTLFDTIATEVFRTENTYSEQTFTLDDLLSNLDNFINLPAGGTPWLLFGKTGQDEYSFQDAEGFGWSGVRPVFPQELTALDGTEILVQGYMFPLGQDDRQSVFLLGPFPLSCPFHYHVTPNLIIEVHAQTPIAFSFDAVNIKGRLELVPEDDEYNVFYRLHDAVLIR